MILWALPAGLMALAVAVLLYVAGRLSKEIAELGEAAQALRTLRAPVSDLRREADLTRSQARHLGSRYRPPSP